jgi:hypothetical protein
VFLMKVSPLSGLRGSLTHSGAQSEVTASHLLPLSSRKSVQSVSPAPP